MSNYSKLIGTVLGGIVGILVNMSIIPEGAIDPMWISSISTLLGAAIGVYWSPPNQPTV